MRTLICLMVVLSGLASGCSSDGDSKDDGTDVESGNVTGDGDDDSAGNGDGNSDGDSEEDGDGDGDEPIEIPEDPSTGGQIEAKYPECPREMIPPTFDSYDGPRSLSQEEFTACNNECGQDESCFETKCPGIDDFYACANTEIIACSAAKEGGECRVAYENFVCCAAASECPADDDNCVTTKCADDLTVLQGCVQADNVCFGKAQTCFGDDEPSMSDDGIEPQPEPQPAPSGSIEVDVLPAVRQGVQALGSIR